MPPSANHWMPDATVKMVGVGEERSTAATPPVTRPVVPGRQLAERNHAILNNFRKRSEHGIEDFGHNGLAILRFNSRTEI